MPSQARPILIAAFIAGSAISQAHADFRYAPGDEGAGSPASVSSTPLRPVVRQAMPAYSAKGLTPGEGDAIDGFGKQVPLVLALREVVPSTYQFAYAPGINLGALVDWKGGRPWHDVLNELLASRGLYASESDQVISIAKQ